MYILHITVEFSKFVITMDRSLSAVQIIFVERYKELPFDIHELQSSAYEHYPRNISWFCSVYELKDFLAFFNLRFFVGMFLNFDNLLLFVF